MHELVELAQYNLQGLLHFDITGLFNQGEDSLLDEACWYIFLLLITDSHLLEAPFSAIVQIIFEDFVDSPYSFLKCQFLLLQSNFAKGTLWTVIFELHLELLIDASHDTTCFNLVKTQS